MNDSTSPILIIGMHRSGTSLLARLLESAGVFLGAHLDRHHESRLHSRINKRILSASACNWANPAGIDLCLLDVDGKDRSLRFVDACHQTFSARADCRAQREHGRWGFKDPKTTLTLSVWLARYPSAHVVHIHRHGLDVALSLRQRAMSRRSPEYINDHPARLLRQGARMGRDLFDGRCQNLTANLCLWDQYLSLASQYRQQCSHAGWHEVNYQSMLASPETTLSPIFKALELPPPDQETLSAINSDRALAWTGSNDPVFKHWLADEATEISARLTAHGYQL